MTNIYANGKLLLTGEYFVLDGALALALPVCYGQSLDAESYPEAGRLTWVSKEKDGTVWFSGAYELSSLAILHTSDRPTAETLASILTACRRQNPDFLQHPEGVSIQTRVDFPRNWGLGTSSTLIAALSRWAGVDPYAVLAETLGGSGYDIACAFAETPIFYQTSNLKLQTPNLKLQTPNLELQTPSIQPVEFHPPFTEHLYFVYLGKKQDSRLGIQRYRERAQGNERWIAEITKLTLACAASADLRSFESVLKAHEALVSQVLDLPRAKSLYFPDFWGEVKSLGAWGGDFVLATSERSEAETRRYFQQQGFETVLTWQQMVG